MGRNRICYFILGLLISVILLFTATELVAFNEKHYTNLFVKYDVTEVTGLEIEELKEIMGDVMLYLKDNRPLLDTKVRVDGEEVPAFGERAVLHMIDVKELFTAGRNIRNYGALITLGLIIFLVKKDGKWKENLSKTLFYVGLINILLMALLFILMLFAFYKYFTYFHLIFFDNDLWILEADELMIQMLPEGFFNDMAIMIGTCFFGGSLLMGILGYLGSKASKL